MCIVLLGFMLPPWLRHADRQVCSAKPSSLKSLVYSCFIGVVHRRSVLEVRAINIPQFFGLQGSTVDEASLQVAGCVGLKAYQQT